MIVEKSSPNIGWKIIAFYISAFAAGGVVQPFLNLYLVEVGLTGSQIGILQGWTAFIAVLVTPLIGIFTDRTQRHRLSLRVIVFLKGLSPPLMMVSSAFSWLVGAVSLRVITASAQDAIMNRLTLKRLQEIQRINFGAVRFWGALSFSITSILAGYLAKDATVSVMFPLAAVLGTAAVFFVGAFPKQITSRLSAHERKTLPLRSPQLWSLFVVIFVYSLGRNGFQTFHSIYLVEKLGASNAFIGTLGAVGSLAPLPAYYLADRLLSQVGAIQLMAVGFGLSAFSWAGLALIPTFQPALVLIFLQGFAVAFNLVTLVILLSQIGLPQRAATDQMLAQLTIPGVAGIVAQPLSGWLFDGFGGSTVLMIDAGLAVVAIGLLFALSGMITTGDLHAQ